VESLLKGLAMEEKGGNPGLVARKKGVAKERCQEICQETRQEYRANLGFGVSIGKPAVT